MTFHGTKTYSESRSELPNLQMLKKMPDKSRHFWSLEQPCEPQNLDVALNKLRKHAVFLLLRSTSVSQLLRQKKREIETKGMRRPFLSDQAAIAVTEGEKFEPKTVNDAECQTIEFDYMSQTNRYQAANTDDKGRFYIGLPSMEISTDGCFRAHLLTCYTALNRFPEFIIVPIRNLE